MLAIVFHIHVAHPDPNGAAMHARSIRTHPPLHSEIGSNLAETHIAPAQSCLCYLRVLSCLVFPFALVCSALSLRLSVPAVVGPPPVWFRLPRVRERPP